MEELIDTILSYKHSTPEQTIETFYITWVISEKQRQELLDLLAKNTIIT